MENNNINKIFENLEGSFDIETPKLGHELRFLDKLKNSNNVAVSRERGSTWKPFLAIAASLVLMISVFTYTQQNSKDLYELANVSPEMATTQDFFANTIATELEKLDEVKSPETQKLVDDAIFQISILDAQYLELKKDLSESGNDKRVIFAMITNFQNRIDVLQSVIQQIENVNQLKNNQNEKSTTI